MRRDRVAEHLLSLVAPPERAASAVGDLMEEAGERERIRFWRSVTWLWLSMLGRDLVRTPFAMAASSAIAWFLYMGLSVVLALAGYIAVTLIWGAAYVLTHHTGVELLASVLRRPGRSRRSCCLRSRRFSSAAPALRTGADANSAWRS